MGVTSTYQKKVEIQHNISISDIIGAEDRHLKLFEKSLKVNIYTSEDHIIIDGSKENVQRGEKLIKQVIKLIDSGFSLHNGDLKFILQVFMDENNVDLFSLFSEKLVIPSKNYFITPKSLTQREYIYSIKHNDITIGIGSAGTGKTYLAVAAAISELLNKRFEKIVLARPAVDAGEKLGFLPGDLYEKINPYLRPMYDALYEMVEYEKAQKFIEKGIIEIAPLAYMRGRTLNDAFIILDEAQNSTTEQMKMFLTRLGINSKAVITGDITQVDLPCGTKSGLIEIQTILNHIDNIKFVYFSEKDVVRHELVKHIIKAYESHSNTTVNKL